MCIPHIKTVGAASLDMHLNYRQLTLVSVSLKYFSQFLFNQGEYNLCHLTMIRPIIKVMVTCTLHSYRPPYHLCRLSMMSILVNYSYDIVIILLLFTSTSIICSFHHHSSCHNIHVFYKCYSEVTKYIIFNGICVVLSITILLYDGD